MSEDKPSAPTADEALSAWEQGAGNTPDAPPHPKLAHLKSRFAAHTDVCSLEAVLPAAMNDASDAVPVTVEVQPGLLALLAHIEELDSARVGRNPAPPSRLLAQIVSNYLENLLHTIVTDPTSHPHYQRFTTSCWRSCEGQWIPRGAGLPNPVQRSPFHVRTVCRWRLRSHPCARQFRPLANSDLACSCLSVTPKHRSPWRGCVNSLV